MLSNKESLFVGRTKEVRRSSSSFFKLWAESGSQDRIRHCWLLGAGGRKNALEWFFHMCSSSAFQALTVQPATLQTSCPSVAAWDRSGSGLGWVGCWKPWTRALRTGASEQQKLNFVSLPREASGGLIKLVRSPGGPLLSSESRPEQPYRTLSLSSRFLVSSHPSFWYHLSMSVSFVSSLAAMTDTANELRVLKCANCSSDWKLVSKSVV